MKAALQTDTVLLSQRLVKKPCEPCPSLRQASPNHSAYWFDIRWHLELGRNSKGRQYMAGYRCHTCTDNLEATNKGPKANGILDEFTESIHEFIHLLQPRLGWSNL